MQTKPTWLAEDAIFHWLINHRALSWYRQILCLSFFQFSFFNSFFFQFCLSFFPVFFQFFYDLTGWEMRPTFHNGQTDRSGVGLRGHFARGSGVWAAVVCFCHRSPTSCGFCFCRDVSTWVCTPPDNVSARPLRSPTVPLKRLLEFFREC